ncbi:MAG: hypothetical protein M1838_005901 [Thelocarpon superellum]|nr:MAG: hypothetical protein M1838_005901 [Thelocarpon superellum]
MFDKWYEFAANRSSIVIDDFDSIHDDLAPFWSLQPSDLRDRTWEATSNPWNEISAISVRNGVADLAPNTIPTHRWMLEGVLQMMQPFCEWLPDMDIALNLNDECRVAVPWHKEEETRMLSHMMVDAMSNNPALTKWSTKREEGWKETSTTLYDKTRFEDLSFTNIFHAYGAVTCPPESLARTQRRRGTTGLCLSCVQPHSTGAFVSNWTLASKICHQPDLADLHGFFLSPAAFKGTHELMPVFSQSKVSGFNDIIYPSAWNYVDKASYQPTDEEPDLPFSQKNGTLFWRGSTTEGVSLDGTWKGMTRQRLIHMTSDLTAATHVPVLLPRGRGQEGYEYENVAIRDVGAHLRFDVGTIDQIQRCSGRDCADQEQEFGFKTSTGFQQHWGYKYLFDLDGAGFSGRFLPFLHSHSLPIKTALFREWYDSRLTAWVHFFPQDLRLHGVYSTLAYFAGIQGPMGGRRINLRAHAREAETIAEQGREWAAKVLRKEDMEIYFFRLLLEWGRLTDDARDQLGFA